jgi:hypothetical protein
VEDRALIRQQLAASHQIVKQCLTDITEGEAGRPQAAILAPVVWQIGHLAVTNTNFIQRAGATSSVTLPARYPEVFKTGTGGPASYPSLGEVVKAFDDTHEALMRTVSEAKLDTPTEGPRGLWKNYSEMFSFANTHRWYHIGKLNSLRALLGKPRLFG